MPVWIVKPYEDIGLNGGFEGKVCCRDSPNGIKFPNCGSSSERTTSTVKTSPTMPAISFLPFLQTIPPATRLLTALLLVGSLAAFILMFVRQDSGVEPPRLSWLVLVPGESYWYPWTLLTAGWVEMTIFEVSLSFAEPAGGGRGAANVKRR